MADQNITDGVVSFEDGVKASEEYAPAKKVRVELTFAVIEGEDGEEVLARVGDLARAQVARLLGKAPAAVQAANFFLKNSRVRPQARSAAALL